MPYLLDNPLIRNISSFYNKTPAQIIICWHLKRGRSVIPKSVNEMRIIENAKVFDFHLSDADLASIDDLDISLRIGPHPNNYGLEFLK